MKRILAKNALVFAVIAVFTSACGTGSKRRLMETPGAAVQRPSWSRSDICTMIFVASEQVDVSFGSGSPADFTLYADYQGYVGGPLHTRVGAYLTSGNKLTWNFDAYEMENYRIRVVRNGVTVATSNEIKISSSDGCHPDGNTIALTAP